MKTFCLTVGIVFALDTLTYLLKSFTGGSRDHSPVMCFVAGIINAVFAIWSFLLYSGL